MSGVAEPLEKLFGEWLVGGGGWVCFVEILDT